MPVKLVQDHITRGIALDFDDDAHAVAIGFITNV